MSDLESFRSVVSRELLRHPVVADNAYTAWFSRGEADDGQVADLLVQFSVFSNHFLVVQAKRMVNAGTLEGERCARDILVNECGVGIDVSTGSAEGRTFSSGNAHLNWLREAGAVLGLEPAELGRWNRGSLATRRFLEGLERSYGSRDPMIGAGASFAIESWAAHGLGCGPEAEARNFWRQLIGGLDAVNRRRQVEGLERVPTGFFRFHAETETGHGAGVWRELEKTFDESGFDGRRFLHGGRRALDALQLFWRGLDESRRRAGRDTLADINVSQWAL